MRCDEKKGKRAEKQTNERNEMKRRLTGQSDACVCVVVVLGWWWSAQGGMQRRKASFERNAETLAMVKERKLAKSIP